ncbi:hypothetical protein ACJZ2D_001157 [Fusarium nematophilum]
MSSPAPDSTSKPTLLHSLVLPREHANLDWRRERGVRKFFDKTGHFPCELAPQCRDTYWDAFTFLERILTLGVRLSEQSLVTFDDVKVFLAGKVLTHKPKAQSKLQLSDVDAALDHFFTGGPATKQPSPSKRSLSHELEEDSIQVSAKRTKLREPLSIRPSMARPPSSITQRVLYSSDSASSPELTDDFDTDRYWTPGALSTDHADDGDTVIVNTSQNGDKTDKTLGESIEAASGQPATAKSPESEPVDGDTILADAHSASTLAPTSDIPLRDTTRPKISQSKSPTNSLSRPARRPSRTCDALNEIIREMEEACRKCSEAMDIGTQRIERLQSFDRGQDDALEASTKRAEEVHDQILKEYREKAKAQVEAGSNVDSIESLLEMTRSCMQVWQDEAAKKDAPALLKAKVEHSERQLIDLNTSHKTALNEHRQAADAFYRTKLQMNEVEGKVADLKGELVRRNLRKERLAEQGREAKLLGFLLRSGPGGLGPLGRQFPGLFEAIEDISKESGA